MELETSRFGKIEIQEEDIISFPEGIIGFFDKKRFVVYDYQKGNPFKWLQSVDQNDLAFIITDPEEFMSEYSPKVLKSDLKSLGVAEVKDTSVFVIIVVPEDPQKMYANLLGPLIINKEGRLGKQVILQTDTYSTCHYILEELKQSCGANDAGTVTETE